MTSAHRITSSLLLVALLCIPAAAQFSDPAQASFREGMHLIQNRGQILQGLLRLEQTAEAFPDSKWGAEALLQIGYFSLTEGESIAAYERLILLKPDTEFAAAAKLNILALQTKGDPDAWILGLKELAHEFCSPPVDEILSGIEVEQNVALVRALSFEQQVSLGQIYTHLWDVVAYRNRDFEPGAQLIDFIRSALEPNGAATGASARVHLAVLHSHPGLTTSSELLDPGVVISNPEDGSTVSPDFELLGQIVGADYLHSQVSLSRVTISLDDVDLKPNVQFYSTHNYSAQEGEPLETIDFVCKFESLTPGKHELAMSVQVQGYQGEGPGRVQLTRTFYVSTTPPTSDLEDPHCSEGANTLLTPERITGKATRNVVGFDLSNVQAAGLTSATLSGPGDHRNGTGGLR